MYITTIFFGLAMVVYAKYGTEYGCVPMNLTSSFATACSSRRIIKFKYHRIHYFCGGGRVRAVIKREDEGDMREKERVCSDG